MSNDRMPVQTQKPSIGRIVIHRTQQSPNMFAGSKDHPAIVTRVWDDRCINVKVQPDCGPPYDATSQVFIDPSDENASGWFWPPRVGG